jgi:pimeloyl-[acyl-carrier protein] methyl ester esterase
MTKVSAQKPPLILVHGWGFNNAIWRDVIDLLPGFECHSIELGFLLGAPQGTSSMPPEAVGIGHSFGLMWLLKHGRRPLRGLVSIAGFDCFTAHVEPRQIEAMKRGLDRDPVAQMQRFWRACGTEDFTQRENYDVSALKGGLDWLGNWDEREARRELTCPLVALGSKDDAIVPIEMTQSIWGDTDLRLCPDGGHALPLSQPQWCADEINEFVARLSD